jgi:hypothetical protein
MFEEFLELCNIKSNELEREQKKVRELTELLVGMNRLSGYINSKQSDVALLGRLIDQVDSFSKELADLKSQMVVIQPHSSIPAQRRGTKKGKSLDNHTRALIEILKDRPGKYDTRDLMDMLGMHKNTVIRVMNRATEIDPVHIKLTRGKGRKLYLSYIPDGDNQMRDTHTSSGNEDLLRLELMSMT